MTFLCAGISARKVKLESKRLILEFSYKPDDLKFINIIIRSLIDLLDQKGSPTEIGEILKKADAGIRIFNEELEGFMPLKQAFKKEVKLPLWIK